VGRRRGDEQEMNLDFNNEQHVMDWVFEQCDWPAVVKLCYLLLYARYHRQQTRDMGHRELAKELGTEPHAFGNALRQLVALGAVKVIKPQRQTMPPSPDDYRVLPPWEGMQYLERKPRGWWAKEGHVEIEA
jgi:hypothetical protein